MFAGNVEKQLKWLYGLQSNGIKLGLRNIEHLLRRMGNPQNNFRTIHVAGSDGKGSTCAILASVLRQAGYKVGLFTSPHVLRFNERISIDGEDITDEDLAFFASRVRHFVDDMRESEINCTFFEVTTAMAFDYFNRKEVDIAVIEVGMGGRFDATNVIVPDVSVINNISLEHMDYLGDTIGKIAFEKAGIIKAGVPVVTMNPEPALGVIRQVAGEVGADLTVVDPADVEVVSNGPTGPTFAFRGVEPVVTIPGRNEARNAAVALTALSLLPDYRERIEPVLDRGLSSVRWPCRLEDLGNGYIVDVTHTNAGSVGLAADVAEIYGKVVLVFGLLDDKDVEDISRNLAGVASKVVVTSPACPRAKPIDETFAVMSRHFPGAEKVEGVARAIERANELRSEGEKVLIAGSFYMAEEALRWMGRTSL
ncbi:MAG: bifunctional folylpolyglutamate synthase/dihydrofolate synthase [archaeon]|nr:bifunctional folylpolyglutamate synthase/dihydrofolate synthase [archaeon]